MAVICPTSKNAISFMALATPPKVHLSCWDWFTAVALILWLHNWSIVLWLVDDDIVWQWHLGTHLALRVMRKHDLDLDTNHALAHCHMADCFADVVPLWFTCRNKISILELHGLGTLRAKLAADDDFAPLCAILHDEADDAIACAAHCQASQELVAQGFGLSHGTGRTVLNTLSEKLHTVLGKVVALLDDSCQLANAAALLSQHLTCTCGADNDLGPDGCHTHLNACITIFCESAHQKLVELSIEDPICDEFALLGHLGLVSHPAKLEQKSVEWTGTV